MSAPLIACICLAYRNEDFLARAKRCYWSQSEKRGDLYIRHTSEEPGTIGTLRNRANALVPKDAKYIAHWDYDDVSMPERLAHQLAFAEETGSPVVGYFDMAFYDAVRDRVLYYNSRLTNYGLGTSLFYKREAWERVKFPDQTPEDTTWQHQIGHDNIRGCSSIVDGKPMMIQVLHGKNAAASASGAIFEKASEELEKQVREILRNA